MDAKLSPGQRVKWKVGRSPKPVKGEIVRFLKKGTKIPAGVRTASGKTEVYCDSYLLLGDDEVRRVVRVGAVRKMGGKKKA